MSMRSNVLAAVSVLALAACGAPEATDVATEERTAPVRAAATPTAPTQVFERASVSSPDGEIVYSVFTENGLLRYSVEFGDETVVAPSRLGLRFAEGFGPDENIEIIGISEGSSDTTWEQPWGERRTVRDHHNELVVEARRVEPDIRFTLRVRVFDDGLGFRYEFGEQASVPDTVSITDELTEFNVGRETESWWIPSRQYNRYEYLYQNTPVDSIQMVHTPITLRRESGTHLSIHEAALVN